MSKLLNSTLLLKEKTTYDHPWERTIKDILSSRIKYAHNSVRNPKIPRTPDEKGNRIKFTIIGDRITKDFIYCVNIVNGLHKYRRKTFDVPSIRGVNTVDWPEECRKLKNQYGGTSYCLSSPVAVLVNDRFLGGKDELQEMVDSKYIYHLVLDYYNESIAQFASYIRSFGRSCAYMQFSIDSEHIGTMIFMLYSDILPYTCENFLRLCKETRGGYSGTPVHRIVKDGWIQCGGFGLKSVELDCENFIIPHDKRGVLCMANDGRHIDCSTQFFVLLQPAPWMAHRYVAFGQLIEGANTLDKIEQEPTWYESPKSQILIDKAGIFNMECQDITINKGTNEYLQGHIEDLVALGDALMEGLIERVFLEIEMKLVEKLRKEQLGEAEEKIPKKDSTHIHATERFIRKKEEIQSQIQTPLQVEEENKDFDVEEYEQEESYQPLSLPSTSIVVKPETPYYLAFTDVPYPGERDSTFDLKRFLQGDYCLESDLPTKAKKKSAPQIFPSDFFQLEEEDPVSSDSIDSNDEQEIKAYLRTNTDNVSFAGEVIKKISRKLGACNMLDDSKQSDLLTDEALRRIRLASQDLRGHTMREKKVSISIPIDFKRHSRIKRRQTGFVHSEELQKLRLFNPSIEEEDNESIRKVRIAPDSISTPGPQRSLLRPKGLILPSGAETELTRQSVLKRLYDDVNKEDNPTLKDYRPMSEHHSKNVLLTESLRPNYCFTDSDVIDKLHRTSVNLDDESFENFINLKHGKKIARKISSDYVKTIDQMEHRLEPNLRNIEFVKLRPSMSVSAYQLKNQKYQQEQKLSNDSPTNLSRCRSDKSERAL